MSEASPLRIGVIDDDVNALPIISGSLKSFLANDNVSFSLSTFSSSDTLLDPEMKAKNDFDLLFCDIEMPKKDGIQVAFEYQKDHPSSQIIFLSNREDKVFDSLLVHPFGFIRKKNFFVDCEKVFRSFFEYQRNKEDKPSILLKTGADVIRLPLDQIIVIEAVRRNQLVHVVNQPEPIKITSSMKELCAELESKGFIHCHKSFLVNYLFILVIEKDTIVLKNGQKIYVSRRKATAAKDKFLSLIQSDKPLAV